MKSSKIKFVIYGAAVIMLVLLFVIKSKRNDEDKNNPPYTYVENVTGLGCLKIGSTISEVKAAIDSNYHSTGHRKESSVLQQHDFIYECDAPAEYLEEYKKYKASIYLSEDNKIKDIELKFFRDSLFSVALLNTNMDADDVGKAFILKYGKGKGFCRKTADSLDEYHCWGNEICKISFAKQIKYSLNSQGIANSVYSRFCTFIVEKNDPELDIRIEQYLKEAEKSWNVKQYEKL